jgi:hypothetical protein
MALLVLQNVCADNASTLTLSVARNAIIIGKPAKRKLFVKGCRTAL